MSRRKAGTLIPLESEILDVALAMLRAGLDSFYGFGLAQVLREQAGSRSLTAHGTLYKALARLEELGLLSSHWEEATAAPEGRPRRRLYRLTALGVDVAESRGAAAQSVRPALAPEPA